MMVLDLMVILGTTIGMNLLLELDMFVCVCTVDALLFLLIVPLLGRSHAKVLSISITGLVILFFAPNTLSTETNVVSIVKGMIPRVKRESWAL
jgi:hypothetical protein